MSRRFMNFMSLWKKMINSTNKFKSWLYHKRSLNYENLFGKIVELCFLSIKSPNLGFYMPTKITQLCLSWN